MTTNLHAGRAGLLLLCAACGYASHAAAQAYPTRPVQLIVPFAATGSTSLVFRVLQPRLSERLGEQVVIVNRPGGMATIGMAVVAQGSPDGYTLGAATLSFTANPSFFPGKMPFDAARDLVPVSQITRLPMVLVIHPKVPAKSVGELIALAKAKPGSLNYGSAGVASSGHLGGAMFEAMGGVRMTHVPFSATGSAAGLVGGETQLQISPVPSVLAFIRAGRLTALGVATGKPVAALPGVPTIAESGVPGFEVYEWSGIVAPAKTPSTVVSRLHQEFVSTLADSEIRKQIAALGAEVVGGTPAALGAHIRKELAIWAKVAEELRLRAGPGGAK